MKYTTKKILAFILVMLTGLIAELVNIDYVYLTNTIILYYVLKKEF